MKNWKTTLAGIILAALYALVDVLKNGAQLDDWKLWIVPVFIGVMGAVSKDFDVTGAAKKLPLWIGCLCMLCLASCAGLQNQVNSETTITAPDGTVTHTKTTASNSDAALAAGTTLIRAGITLAGPRIYPDK